MSGKQNEQTKKQEIPHEELKEPGLRGVKTSNAFRVLNFELFVKPNRTVMAVGTGVFLASCCYILYLRLTDDFKDIPTYDTINEDGSLGRRIKTSKWE